MTKLRNLSTLGMAALLRQIVHQPSILDSVGIFVLLAAWMFSSEVAAVAGPYMVIISASAIGASFALIRRDASTRVGAAFYFLRVCGLATLLTVAISTVLSLLHPSLTERVLIAPVALGLGLIGDDYPSAGRWVLRWVNKLIDTLISIRGGKGQ